MCEFDRDKLHEVVKQAVSQWEAFHPPVRHVSDITSCVQRALRARAYREKTGEGGAHDRIRELIAFVGDAQRRIRDETERGVSYEHICDRDSLRSAGSCKAEALDNKNASKRILEWYELVQSWRERLSRKIVSGREAGIHRPRQTLCERLAMRTNEEVAEIAAMFRRAGVDVSRDDCTVSITFPDGIQAFWCVCQSGDVIEGRSAMDLSLTGSVFGSAESEETVSRARRELFLYGVAEALAWH